MGDIWPYGPPKIISWFDAFNEMRALGVSSGVSTIMAAIAEADGGLDLTVINDTPSTGDYSVGTYQINYFGNLYHERTALFGTPQQLIRSGIVGQSKAGLAILLQQGFTAWGAYNNGSYRQFLHGGSPIGPSQPHVHEVIPPPNNPGADSWSGAISHGSEYLQNIGYDSYVYANTIRLIRGG